MTAESATMTAWRKILAWDEALLLRISRWKRPLLTRFMRAVTHIGDSPSWIFVGVVLAAVGSGTTTLLAYRLLVGGVGAALVAQVVKRLSKRRRPSHGIAGFEAMVANPDAFSFPSGHTAAAVAVAVAWAGEGTALGSVTTGFAVVVGFSRVYLGAHYPLDVLAGAFLGLLVGVASRFVVG